MNAASTPPEQGRTTTNTRHLPPEILEQILLNLPMKSLLRFSTVSKSWNSTIFESIFVQIHKSRAALDGRVKIVTFPSPHDHLTAGATVRRVSLTSSEHPIAIEDSSALICPIEGTPHLRAYCDELWLVEAKNSLFLWNHSMRTYRKLPDSLLPSESYRLIGFIYGLAYDSAAEDYKILKIVREDFSFRNIEMYSLKRNSWKQIPASSRNSIIKQNKCEFVNGAFHWIRTFRSAIVAFSLSSEKYGEFALPDTKIMDDGEEEEAERAEVAVLRGKLCVCVNYSIWWDCSSFILWVMEEYGVEKSWSKNLHMEYSPRSLSLQPRSVCILRPLCCYSNGDILFNLLLCKDDKSELLWKEDNVGLFMSKNGGALLEKIVVVGAEIRGGFIYLETLVSPLTHVI